MGARRGRRTAGRALGAGATEGAFRPRRGDRGPLGWQSEHAWGIFVQPLAFFLFLAASCAETKRVPFDQPEGESEIVAGYFVEYSGFKFGMFFMGEYIELITSSALLCTLFLGVRNACVERGATLLFHAGHDRQRNVLR